MTLIILHAVINHQNLVTSLITLNHALLFVVLVLMFENDYINVHPHNDVLNIIGDYVNQDNNIRDKKRHI